MGPVLHRFLTGIAVAVAVVALLLAWMTQAKVGDQQRQLDRQRLANWAVSNALDAQRKLNGDLSRNLIRVMRQQSRTSVPARYLTTR